LTLLEHFLKDFAAVQSINLDYKIAKTSNLADLFQCQHTGTNR